MKKLFSLSIFIYHGLIPHTIKQNTNNVKQLLEDAQHTQIHIINILKNVPYALDVIDPGIKEMDTINRLLETRNKAEEITDYSRITIVVKDFPSIYWCLNWLKKYINILSIDDHYLYPYATMYRDINIIFEDPINKHIGEIQINSKAMVEFKNLIGHDLFHQIRLIQAKEKLEHRNLTLAELDSIEVFLQMAQIGHNAAFKKSYAHIRLGVYGICIQNNKILMVKTWAGDKYIYNFPGGGLEHNESLADCLIRECQEELGCNIIINDLLATSDKLYENNFFHSQNFNVYYNMELENSIHDALEGATWFDMNQLPLDMMLDSDKFIIQNFSNKS